MTTAAIHTQRFAQPIRFHACLDHPNVVKLWGFTSEPHMCIVLELMERGSVFDLMQVSMMMISC